MDHYDNLLKLNTGDPCKDNPEADADEKQLTLTIMHEALQRIAEYSDESWINGYACGVLDSLPIHICPSK